MPSAPSDDLSSLWKFSLAVYARAGVADVCLRLQDEHGANVNLLLWCVWLERHGLRLDKARLAHAQQCIQSWDENYVIPLRQLRRRMKMEFGVTDAGIEHLRTQIKTAELLAEKQVQIQLEHEVLSWTAAEDCAAPRAGENLSLYLQQFHLSDLVIAEVCTLFK